MKTMIVQLWQWVLKHRKKIIYGALALFAFQICFFDIGGFGVQNEVFAAEGGNSANQNAVFDEKVNTWLLALSFFQKVVYIVIYPILAIMGKLVDNSLVYGEFFGFDAVLWQLWNIVRNLANFGLGFLFLYYVFRYILNVLGKSGKSNDKGPKWIIMRSLIAGVGIQASWFIMGALIDLSTILAYGVGGLPISTLGTQTDIGNPYILQTVISVDSDDVDSMAFYLSEPVWTGTHYISQCETFTFQSGTIQETLLLAPKYIYYKNDGKYYPTEKTKCHYDDQVYYFKKLHDSIKWQTGSEGDDEQTWKNNQHIYHDSVTNAPNNLKNKADVENFIKDAVLLQIGDAHATGGVSGNIFTGIQYDGDNLGLDVKNEWVGKEWKLPSLKDTLSGSYVGVFSALYASLLNAGYNMRVSNVDTDVHTVGLLNAVLSFCHMMAIAIPLLVMMIVLVMRIGVLWMAIALSPMIVLLTVFGFDEKIDKNSILSNLTIGNLLPIIFSPAIICFAVSVSTVVVRIILNLNWAHVDITSTDDIMGGLVQLGLSGLGIALGKLVCGAIGIAITWFLLWTAVETSKLGKSKMVQGLKSLATTVLGSVPIVPVVGMGEDGKLKTDFVGTTAAFGDKDGNGGLISNFTTRLKNQYQSRDNEILNDWVDSSRVSGRRADAYKQAVLGFTPQESVDWTDQEISIRSEDGSSEYKLKFNDVLDSKKDDIIKAINDLDKDKRALFGKSSPTINGTNDVVYEFKDGKYVVKKE